jgi:hypothetical protein
LLGVLRECSECSANVRSAPRMFGVLRECSELHVDMGEYVSIKACPN